MPSGVRTRSSRTRRSKMRYILESNDQQELTSLKTIKRSRAAASAVQAVCNQLMYNHRRKIGAQSRGTPSTAIASFEAAVPMNTTGATTFSPVMKAINRFNDDAYPSYPSSNYLPDQSMSLQSTDVVPSTMTVPKIHVVFTNPVFASPVPNVTKPIKKYGNLSTEYGTVAPMSVAPIPVAPKAPRNFPLIRPEPIQYVSGASEIHRVPTRSEPAQSPSIHSSHSFAATTAEIKKNLTLSKLENDLLEFENKRKCHRNEVKRAAFTEAPEYKIHKLSESLQAVQKRVIDDLRSDSSNYGGIGNVSDMRVANVRLSDKLIIAQIGLEAAHKQLGEAKESIAMFQANDSKNQKQMKQLWDRNKKLERYVAKLTGDCKSQSKDIKRLMRENAKALNNGLVHPMDSVNNDNKSNNQYERQLRVMKFTLKMQEESAAQQMKQMQQRINELERESKSKVVELYAAKNRAKETTANLAQATRVINHLKLGKEIPRQQKRQRIEAAPQPPRRLRQCESIRELRRATDRNGEQIRVQGEKSSTTPLFKIMTPT